MTSPARLAGEWEQQAGALVSWPTRSTDWRDNFADAEATYLELAVIIARINHLYICCDDLTTRQHVQELLTAEDLPTDRYDLFTIPYNDTWTRDYGPISVYRENAVAWLNYEFNAWGGKFAHQQDNQLTQALHQHFSDTRVLQNIDFVLEGGSIDSDGAGTVLTTSQCLLDHARNPSLSKEQIEDKLKSSLGIQRVLWLDHGHLEGDDTDAHIDTLARFCSADMITYVQCTDPADAHFESLSAMEKQLKSFHRLDGQKYRLIPLPLPTACFNQAGQRLPASYANFLILNGHVLAPVYGVETDSYALAQLQQCFPDHNIAPVQCRSLIEQSGSLHCITMQML